jgi:hypothetical protein
MPVWEKLAATYTRLRLADEIVSMSKETAVSISDLVRPLVDAVVPGIDWQWDTRGEDPSAGFGWSGLNFSFPGKPSELSNNGILGGLLVKGNLAVNPKPGEANTVHLEVGYYHKLPGASGEGKYSMETDLGTYDINFDAKGNPSWTKDEDTGQEQDFGRVGAGVQDLVQHIVAHPPFESKSKAVQKKVQKYKEQQQVRQKGEKQLEQEKADLSGPYSSIESFYDHMVDENDGVFGPPDLDMLAKGMFKSPAERASKKGELLQQLKDTGMTFDPKKTKLSAGPSSVADILRIIANNVEQASRPSIAAVTADLESVIAILT